MAKIKLNMSDVKNILGDKLSKNENRFECANGIVFTVNTFCLDEDFFLNRGIDVIHQLGDEAIFYCETLMSAAEFSTLKVIEYYKTVA